MASSLTDEITSTYSALVSASDKLLGRFHAQESLVLALQTEVNELTEDVSVLNVSSVVLENLLKSISVESLQTVERLVTYGLQVVFSDQSLSLKIISEQKRGVQTLDLRFVDRGVESPILSAFGGGPASVAAFLLRLLVCRRLGLAPLILLDESFSFVSSRYVENVGKLLKELTDKLGITILLVTHERGFLQYADRAYEGALTADSAVFNPVKFAE